MIQLIPPIKKWIDHIKNKPRDSFYELVTLKTIKRMLKLKANAVTNKVFKNI